MDGGHHIEMVGKKTYTSKVEVSGPVWTDCFDVNWCTFGDVLPLAWALWSLSIPTNYITILSSFDTGEISGCHIGLPLSGTSWFVSSLQPCHFLDHNLQHTSYEHHSMAHLQPSSTQQCHQLSSYHWLYLPVYSPDLRIKPPLKTPSHQSLRQVSRCGSTFHCLCSLDFQRHRRPPSTAVPSVARAPRPPGRLGRRCRPRCARGRRSRPARR